TSKRRSLKVSSSNGPGCPDATARCSTVSTPSSARDSASQSSRSTQTWRGSSESLSESRRSSNCRSRNGTMPRPTSPLVPVSRISTITSSLLQVAQRRGTLNITDHVYRYPSRSRERRPHDELQLPRVLQVLLRG